MKIDKRIDIDRAATLLINPPTAYCMLKEFIDLDVGDVVIQNCANSAVGRDVIQLAHGNTAFHINKSNNYL
jgi:trans-2-enoyl-CoA reductase